MSSVSFGVKYEKVSIGSSVAGFIVANEDAEVMYSPFGFALVGLLTQSYDSHPGRLTAQGTESRVDIGASSQGLVIEAFRLVDPQIVDGRATIPAVRVAMLV